MLPITQHRVPILFGGNNLPSLKTLGLAHAWALTANANDLYGAANLTNNNAVTFGANGGDFELDNSQSLSHADTPSLSVGLGNAYFGCAWVKPESKPAGLRTIVSKYSSGQLSYIALLNGTTDRFVFGASSTASGAGGTESGVVANTFGSPALDTLHFVRWYWNPATAKIGIGVNNGVADEVTHADGIYDSTALFRIGATGFAGQFFDGTIGHVLHFLPTQTQLNYLLTDGATRLYNGGTPLPYSAMN